MFVEYCKPQYLKGKNGERRNMSLTEAGRQVLRGQRAGRKGNWGNGKCSLVKAVVHCMTKNHCNCISGWLIKEFIEIKENNKTPWFIMWFIIQLFQACSIQTLTLPHLYFANGNFKKMWVEKRTMSFRTYACYLKELLLVCAVYEQ